MWGAAVIVFREIFEIAIVMCVVLAATKNIQQKSRWVILGIISGIMGACLVAFFIYALTSMAGDEMIKKAINAIILFIATITISWTVIWMKSHSRDMVSQLKTTSNAIAAGTTPLHMLAVIIGLTVLREGSEIVIFLYGLAATGQLTVNDLILGAILGLASGIGAGFLMYFGLIRMSVKYLFQVTTVLLTLIAAGMAANAAGKLVTIGALPALIDSVWNTSAILPQKALLGKFLFILIGYQENPNAMQVLFYLLTIISICIAIKLSAKPTVKMHSK